MSHRLPLALEARSLGYDVALCTGQAGSATLEQIAVEELAKQGIRHWRVAFGASGINPLVELVAIGQMVRQMLRFRPTLVHCASPKGVLYGGIAARLVGVPALVLAVTGMGYAATAGAVSTSRHIAAWATRALSRLAYGHRCKRVVVQNRDDAEMILAAGLAEPAEMRLIPGSGVDLALFANDPAAPRDALVVLPARMLADKGVFEFVAAARMLRQQGCTWRFLLAGTADYANPSAISTERIRTWISEGIVEWSGHVHDMPALLARAAIVCLPSYREGMPKALLEAAAAGCAIVTTDVIGCREAIVAGTTGDLVPAKDASALASALGALIGDPHRRARYGAAGRKLAIEKFGVESVVRDTVGIYSEVISRC